MEWKDDYQLSGEEYELLVDEIRAGVNVDENFKKICDSFQSGMYSVARRFSYTSVLYSEDDLMQICYIFAWDVINRPKRWREGEFYPYMRRVFEYECVKAYYAEAREQYDKFCYMIDQGIELWGGVLASYERYRDILERKKELNKRYSGITKQRYIEKYGRVDWKSWCHKIETEERIQMYEKQLEKKQEKERALQERYRLEELVLSNPEKYRYIFTDHQWELLRDRVRRRKKRAEDKKEEEKNLTRAQRYKKNHKLEAKLKGLKKYQKDPEKYRQYSRDYYQKHKEEISAKRKKKQQENPEYYREIYRRYDARNREARKLKTRERSPKFLVSPMLL